MHQAAQSSCFTSSLSPLSHGFAFFMLRCSSEHTLHPAHASLRQLDGLHHGSHRSPAPSARRGRVGSSKVPLWRARLWS